MLSDQLDLVEDIHPCTLSDDSMQCYRFTAIKDMHHIRGWDIPVTCYR